MAKPIQATPDVTGEDAKKLLREIQEGTPLTPERKKLFAEADRILESANTPFRKPRGS